MTIYQLIRHWSIGFVRSIKGTNNHDNMLSQQRRCPRLSAKSALLLAMLIPGLFQLNALAEPESAHQNVSGIQLPAGDYTSPITGRKYELLYADDFATNPFSRPDWQESWIDDAAKREGLLANRYNIWTRYNGNPSNSSKETSWWSAANITSADSCLVLGSKWNPDANRARKWPGQTGRLTTSGLSAGRLSRAIKYGRWDIVWRMDTSDYVKYAIMLYGGGASWPFFVEIDIAEGNSDGKNKSFFTTLHYAKSLSGPKQQVRLAKGVEPSNGTDYASWHRLSVDFSPNRLDYFLDGKRIVSAASANASGVQVTKGCSDLLKRRHLLDDICYVPNNAIPDQLKFAGIDLGPRRFIFQTQAVKPATPLTPEPAAYIDWVAFYRMKP